MTTDDQAAGHRAHLERLCAEGGPLTAHSRHATTQNPEWFNVKRQQPRQERRALHNEILADFVASRPEVLRNRKAIVLAGPPGAGKSTAQNALIAATRTRPENWLPINPDDFKDELLLKAREDGSYAGYLIPDEVRELEAAGERFYPRELAALVHNESAILAKKAIRDAIDRGDNIIIDGTLSGEKNARAQLEALQAAGYDVKVADVETTQTVSEARILARWERGYLDAEEGLATGREAELGGRWVPRSFSAGLFTTAGAADSVCAANALWLPPITAASVSTSCTGSRTKTPPPNWSKPKDAPARTERSLTVKPWPPSAPRPRRARPSKEDSPPAKTSAGRDVCRRRCGQFQARRILSTGNALKEHSAVCIQRRI
ncbi:MULTISPECIES: zeta toxin family protein [Paenarthrobacter]|uniref:UDP-N-acetylglucosamine kinase n=1 Tax=Paenarthrobacter ureafaciens TaxID=37931 RepID=A0AAX3EQT9_PAEUR|nr:MULTISPECIES: zeta toxin family protein [Paenarthrobacter]NKR09932.1 hypothetical protein [Arthrobacter sp. M5]NKR16747.1 hypothetical protein [Arthrobacter sp. M6]MDO5866921.1 zeta toxin family protein [Paenarthrobacter sp. SD-2]MDO5878034.1 zeta toxin family protein [Paenarthrobacter sp. SD-1]UYV95429.1 zeta toxin family protein [Paenarthrobacter ureafaciens]